MIGDKQADVSRVGADESSGFDGNATGAASATRAWLTIIAAVAIAVVGATGSASAEPAGAAQEHDGAHVAVSLERLSVRLSVVERRLARTRRALRSSRVRLARVERELDHGAPAGRRLTSPDRRFSVVASNDGVRLRGPGTSVVIGSNLVTLASGTGTTLQLAPAEVALRAPSGVLGFSTRGMLTAPLVSLGGSSGCLPVARVNDPVQIQRSGEAPLGTITGGSTGVFSC